MAKTEEYNSKPVPLNKRMGFAGPAWVWSGFGIAFICAVIRRSNSTRPWHYDGYMGNNNW